MTNEYGVHLDRNSYAPSILQDREGCFLCGRYTDLDRHEPLNSYNRKKSKRLGLWVILCRKCHDDTHKHPEKAMLLKRMAQRKAMEHYDWTIEEFRLHFGKNYLEIADEMKGEEDGES